MVVTVWKKSRVLEPGYRTEQGEKPTKVWKSGDNTFTF